MGTNWTREDLKDPSRNVQVATDLLNRIPGIYKKYGVQPDWSNPEFVKLLVAGWNSGYSDAAGVGKVLAYLRARGLPLTHDNVFQNARAAGATQYLQDGGRQAWQRSVADLFFQQPDARAATVVANKKQGTKSFLIKAGVATLAGLLIARFVFR